MLSGMGQRCCRRREGIVDLLDEWTGTSGHVLLEPWVPPHIRDCLAELIAELEAAAPEGLASKRTAFREGGRTGKGSLKFMELSIAERQTAALSQLLNDRFELLVGAQLVRAGALTRMRKDTPDFDCRWGEHEFGIEATTRARQEAAAALEQVMERGLWDGPDVNVTLTRSGELLFSKSPEVIAGISDRVVAGIKERIAHAAEQPQFGSLPVPELGLTAMWRAGMGISMLGMRVTYESPWPSPRRSGTTTGRWSRCRSRTRSRRRGASPTRCRALPSWTCPGWARRAGCSVRRGSASTRTL